MNKIYSKVWNKSLGQLVVASELATMNGKGGGRTGAVRSGLGLAVPAAMMAALLATGWSPPSFASTIPATGGSACGAVGTTVTGPDGISRTIAAQTDGSGNLSLVSGCYAQGGGFLGVTAFGAFSQTTGAGGTAIGYGANAGTLASAMGTGASANNTGDVAIGLSASATGTTTGAVGSAIAVGANGKAAGAGAVAVGNQGEASGQGAVAMGYNSYANATGQTGGTAASGAVAIGNTNIAEGQGSVAIGNTTHVLAAGGVALGDTASTQASNGVALGSRAIANRANDVALGSGSVTAAPHTGSFTIDGSAAAGAVPTSVVSVGTGAVGGERQIQNVGAGVVGANSTDAINGSQLFATNSVVEALGNTVEANEIHYFSVDDNGVTTGGNYGNDGAIGLNALAVGVGASASADTTVAIGVNTLAATTDSTAVGARAQATGAESVAIGGSSVASGDLGTAVGAGAKATGSLGGSTAIGVNASATQLGSTAIGESAKTDGQNAFAGGTSASAAGNNAVALGGNANASDNSAIAIGFSSAASASSAIALGSGAHAATIASIAIGSNASAAGGSDIALGNTASANAGNAMALGNGATATQFGDVALGYGSTTSTPHTGDYVLDGSATPAAGTTSNNGVVSVGSVGHERQIQNVGAGVVGANSTDAINGSQLFATNEQVTTDAADIANNTTDITNLGGRVTTVEGDVTDLGDTVTDINDNGTKYFHANSTLGDSTPSGTDSIAIGPLANAAGNDTVAVGVGAMTGNNYAVAMGYQAKAFDISGVAVGADSIAGTAGLITTSNTAIGVQANAQGGSVAIGATTESSGLGAVAIGYTNTGGIAATGDGSVALGYNAVATTKGGANSAVALGYETQASGGGSFAAGSFATAAYGVAIGDHASAISANPIPGSIAIGNNAQADGFQANIAIGSGAQTNSDVTTSLNTALGFDAKAGTASFAGSATALGANAIATNAFDVALGSGSVTAAPHTGSFTIDGSAAAGAAPTSVVSVGTGVAGGERQIQNVGAGVVSADSTDAVNGSQLFAADTAITVVGTQTTALGAATAVALGGNASYTAAGGLMAPSYAIQGTTYDNVGDALGSVDANLSTIYGDLNSVNDGAGIKYFHTTSTLEDSVAAGTNSVAVGPVASANSTGDVAIGLNASATGTETGVTGSAIAVGANGKAAGAGAVAVGNQGEASGQGAVAMGYTSYANATGQIGGAAAEGAVAIGNTTIAQGQGSVSIGNVTHALGGGSIALGDTAAAIQAKGVALGSGANANFAGDVALGAGSTTAATAGTSSATVGSTTFSGFAGTAPLSTVSIGTPTAQRTITNVAAGRITATSTDAVNGSELFATDSTIYTLAQTTTTADKGNVKYDNNPDGTPNYASVTLGGGADGTTITNLADGAVNAASTDAVNGSQLSGVSQSVATNLGGGSVVNGDGSVSAPTYAIHNAGDTTTADYNNVGDALTALDNGVVSNTTAIDNIANGGGIKYFHANSTLADSQATGTDSVAIGPVAVASGEDAVALGTGATAIGDNATAIGFDAGNGGLATNLYNVAIGNAAGQNVSGSDNSAFGANAGSAVTGDSNVATGVRAGISVTGNRNVASGFFAGAFVAGSNNLALGTGAGSGAQLDPSGDLLGSATINVSNTVALGNVATVGQDDAVAIGHGANASASAGDVALGAGSVTGAAVVTAGDTINGTAYTYAGASAGVTSTVSVGDAGTERTITNVAAGRVAGDSTDAVNGSQLYATNSAVGALGAGAVQYDKNLDGTPNYGSVTLAGGAGGTTITNVAPGAVIPGSTDAVNGGQLDGVSQSVANNLGGGSMVNGDGSVSAPTYVIHNAGDTTNTSNYNNVGDALDALDNGVVNNTTAIDNINNGGGIKYFHANSVLADSQAIGTDSVAIGPDAVANGNGSVALGSGAFTTGNYGGTAIGGGDGTAAGTNIAGQMATATGYGAQAKGVGDTALGTYANTGAANPTDPDDDSTDSYRTAVGYKASATGDTSVALGAFNSASGARSVALGYGAQANNADDVALGSNSVTAGVDVTPSGMINGTPYNYAGASAGVTSVVSVGSAGAERQITNVAAGQVTQSSTDAINGSQLFATNTAVDTLAQTTTTADKGNVKYDTNPDSTPNYASVTLAGTPSTDGGVTGGTRISNVAQGDVSATSTDAVNGSQLNTTNTNVTNVSNTVSNVAGSLGGGASYDPVTNTYVAPSYTTYNSDGTTTNVDNVGDALNAINSTGIKYFHANSTNPDSQALGLGSVAIGPAAVANGIGDLAVGYGTITTGQYGGTAIGGGDGTAAGTNIAGQMATATGYGAQAKGVGDTALGTYANTGAANPTDLDDDSTDSYRTAVGYKASATGNQSIALGTFNSATGVSSVAIGTGATASDDNAVALGSNSVTAAAEGTTGDIINGTAYSYAGTAPTSTVSVGSATNQRTITNVAAGRVSDSSTDAVNGSQLYATDNAISTLAQTTSTADKGNVKYDSNPDGTPNYASVTLGGTPSTDGGVTGGTRISNVAQGDLSVTSTDVVNGSQLFATNSAVTSLGDTVNSITNGGGIKYFHANSIGADSSASGANSVAIGPNAVASTDESVALGDGATTDTAVVTASAVIGGTTYGFAGAAPVGVLSVGTAGSERQIQNVAAGQLSNTSTDAVNGSQLYATNQQVTKNSTDIDAIQGAITNINQGGAGMFQSSADNKGSPTATGTNSAAGGANAVASGANSTAVGNDSAAAGAGSTALGNDAQATADNSVALGAGSVADRDNSVSVGSAGAERQVTNVAAGTTGTDAVNVNQLKASQAGGVQYDNNADGTTNYSSVTMDPGGDPTVIHNVGAGTANNDVANVGQVSNAIQTAQNWSKSYTDQRFNTLNSQLNTIGNRANAGIASTIAMTNLAQPFEANMSGLGVAFGTFHGESGMAVGLSTVSENGRWVIKANASTDTRGDAGAGVGATWMW